VHQLPTFVALPHVMYNVVQLPGHIAGFLGSSHDPFQVNVDPAAADFQLGELELPGEVSLARLDYRATILHTLDQQLRRQDSLARSPSGLSATSPLPDARDTYTEEAFRLLRSPAVRQPFHLDEEDPRLRDHYDRNKHGQSVVLARRLIEAGVRFVTVHDGQYNSQLANWDAHADVFNQLSEARLSTALVGITLRAQVH
jgi:Protein of unknown function (DUF1501)